MTTIYSKNGTIVRVLNSNTNRTLTYIKNGLGYNFSIKQSEDIYYDYKYNKLILKTKSNVTIYDFEKSQDVFDLDITYDYFIFGKEKIIFVKNNIVRIFTLDKRCKELFYFVNDGITKDNCFFISKNVFAINDKKYDIKNFMNEKKKAKVILSKILYKDIVSCISEYLK